MTILAAEPEPADAEHLLRCLKLLGCRPRLATTADEALELLRQELFRQALIAVELRLNGQPLLQRVSLLPAMECVVATGPGSDLELERLARRAGAVAYLPRPVTVAALANALCRPLPDAARSRPP